ncbi:hypothetical protein [Pseudooctadecabacter sp.]|uniref:hypothetical protein n=1 Tax=Pseudooctadecabacter sp. TaxID=1966338 RepID=UPI0035C8213D
MTRFAICALFALAGCAADQVVAPPAADVSLLRNPTANLGSQADVVAQDLAGDWTVRQAALGTWPNGQTAVSFAANGQDLILVTQGVVCASADLCEAETVQVPYVQTLAGRFRAQDAVPAAQPSEIWVYWMDFDDRTMAIGNPNGGFVAILDRAATGGADRITAARDILDWYGYDLSKLRRVEP